MLVISSPSAPLLASKTCRFINFQGLKIKCNFFTLAAIHFYESTWQFILTDHNSFLPCIFISLNVSAFFWSCLFPFPTPFPPLFPPPHSPKVAPKSTLFLRCPLAFDPPFPSFSTLLSPECSRHPSQDRPTIVKLPSRVSCLGPRLEPKQTFAVVFFWRREMLLPPSMLSMNPHCSVSFLWLFPIPSFGHFPLPISLRNSLPPSFLPSPTTALPPSCLATLLSHRSSIMQMNSLKKRDSEGEKERGRQEVRFSKVCPNEEVFMFLFNASPFLPPLIPPPPLSLE